jgi:hypothetical protein
MQSTFKKEAVKASALVGVLTGCLCLSFYFGYKFNEYDRTALYGLGEAKNQIIFSLQEDIFNLTSKVNSCANIYSPEYINKLEKDNLDFKNQIFTLQKSLNESEKNFNEYSIEAEKEIMKLEKFEKNYNQCVSDFETYKNANKFIKIKRIFK